MFKVIGFAISSFLAAVVGGTYGNWLTFIEPVSAFDTNLSVMLIIMAMVGGAGTVWEPLVGAVLISAISEFLWNHFLSLHQLILGLLLILVVMFLPKGIMDIFLFREKKINLKTLGRIFAENISKYKI